MIRRMLKIGKTRGGGDVEVVLKISEQDGKTRLSICGDVWKRGRGDIIAGGQLCDDIKSYINRYAVEVSTVDRIIAIWNRWHLNDMRACCEHQRELNWTYAGHPSEPCPTCGYECGTAWLYEEIPAEVLTEVLQLFSGVAE